MKLENRSRKLLCKCMGCQKKQRKLKYIRHILKYIKYNMEQKYHERKNNLNDYIKWVQVSKKAHVMPPLHPTPQNQAILLIVLNLKVKDSMFRGTKEKRKILLELEEFKQSQTSFSDRGTKGIALGRNCFWARRTGTLAPTWPGTARMKPPGEKAI